MDRVEKLLEKLKTTDRGVIKASVIEELASTGDHRVLRPIIDALNDKDALVRWHAIKSIARFGNDAVVILMRTLDSGDRFLRRNIVHALGELGGEEITDRLIRMLMFDETDHPVLIEVIRALQTIRSARAVDPLITVLKMDDWEMKWRAIHTLGRIGDPKAVEALLESINDPDPDIRWAANIAIENIKKSKSNKERDSGEEDTLEPVLLPREVKKKPISGKRDLGLSTSMSIGAVCIHVNGEINSDNTQIFNGFVDGVISASSDPVEIDLAQCAFIDSFALGTLNNIRKKLKTKKRSMKLSGLNAHLLNVFKTTNLDTIFEIVE